MFLNGTVRSQGEFFHEKLVDHMKYFTSLDEGEPSEKGLLRITYNRWILPRLSYVRGAAFRL